jgi:hypothetical protein
MAAAPDTSPWRETEFDAVLDAAAGDFWPEEVTALGPAPPETPEVTAHCRRTQRRHIKGALQLLGLDVSSTARDRETVSRELPLSLVVLHECSLRIRDGPTMAAWGREGARVLSELPAINRTVSGLLLLGESRGLWGPTLLSRFSGKKPARSVHSSTAGGSDISLPTLPGRSK